MGLTLGEKLKDERTSRKWTIKQVHDLLIEKYQYNLSEGKLSKLENDSLKYSSYDGIVYLAKLYDVSTDYLLGLTTVKPIDNKLQAAADITGLSEKALNNLQRCNEKNNVYWFGNIANSIIESDEFIDIVVFLKKAVIEREQTIDYDIYKVSTKDIAKTKAIDSFHSLVKALENQYKDFLTPYRYDLSIASSLVYSLFDKGKITQNELQYMLIELENGNFDLLNTDLEQIRQTMKERRQKNGKHN